MKTLKNDDIKLMENLVSVNQEALQSVLYKFLQQYYSYVVYDKSFVLAEGDIPIALVAHMDTVFKHPAYELFYDQKKNVMWSPTGMGADDRAGVFSIIQIIKSGLRPHVVFTTDEEIGGVGSSILAKLPCPFKDLNYVIQLDRRGANDCVFYDCDNQEFEEYVEKFGFVTAYGSFTDICHLCPAWKVAGVNLSVGYRDEHSVSEVLFVGQMLDTIEKVKVMLTEKDIPKFEYIPAPLYYYNAWKPYKYGSYYYDDDYDDYDYHFYKQNTSTDPKKGLKNVSYKCHKCGKSFFEDEVLPVKLIKGGTGYYCEDCLLPANVDWCMLCGEPFEVDPLYPHSIVCAECREAAEKEKE